MTDIFISHINEEAELALLLKDWIEESLLEKFTVFVSADDRDILPGDEWFKKISDALNSSKVILLLCSSRSISRPWISFEAGWGWAKNIPVIPVCHSGIAPSILPRPFEKRQGVSIEDDDGFEKLLRGIARHNGINKLPRLNLVAFSKELGKVLGKIKQTPLSTATVEAPSVPVEFEMERNKILSVLEKNERNLTDSMIESMSGVKLSLTKVLLNRLDNEELVWTAHMMNGPNTYGITNDGRELLLKKGLL
jgi:hypothetical protein